MALFDSLSPARTWEISREGSEMARVTLRWQDSDEDNKDYFLCPVCGRVLIVEYAKTGKPYCKCNDCGVQLFIRGKQGIRRFKKLLGKSKLLGDSKELLSSLDYLKALKERLAQVRDDKPAFGSDPDLEFQEKVILEHLSKLKQNMTE